MQIGPLLNLGPRPFDPSAQLSRIGQLFGGIIEAEKDRSLVEEGVNTFGVGAPGSPGTGLAAIFGGQQPAAPTAPGPASAPAPGGIPAAPATGRTAFDAKSVPSFVQAAIAPASEATGISPDYLTRTASIESAFKPNAVSSTGAKGLWQFVGGTARQYGLTNPFDPNASAMAAARLASDNKTILAKSLGREPSDAELYLAHQQGAGGAAKMLANPNARAGDIVGDRAVQVNGGNPNMTAGAFANKWLTKYASTGGRQMELPQEGAPAALAQAPLPPQRPTDMPAGAPPVQASFGEAMGGAPQGFAGMPVPPVQMADADMPAPGATEAQFVIPPGRPPELAAPAVPVAAPQAAPAFQPGSVAVPGQSQPTGLQAPFTPPQAATAGFSPQQAELVSRLATSGNPTATALAQSVISTRMGKGAGWDLKDMKNGQTVLINQATGTVMPVPGGGSAQKFQPQKGSDGNDYTFNEGTGQWTRAVEGVRQGYTDLTDPAQRAAAGVPADYKGPVQRGPNGELKMPGKAGTEVNVDARAASKEGDLKLGANVKYFEGLRESGGAAQEQQVNLGTLRELSRELGNIGSEATLKEAIGPYAQSFGVEVKGLSAIQSYSSIINKLTPQMRVPGSGTTSDKDLALFKSALPGLLQTEGTRELVMDMMQATTEVTARKGQIANQYLGGEIDMATAQRQLRALPEPLAMFNDFRKANPQTLSDAMRTKGQTAKPGAADKGGFVPRTATNPTTGQRLIESEPDKWVPQ